MLWWWWTVAVNAAPLGPGLLLRQVAPPPQPLAEVRRLDVPDWQGPQGAALAAEVRATLADPLRTRPRGSFNEVVLAGVDLAEQLCTAMKAQDPQVLQRLLAATGAAPPTAAGCSAADVVAQQASRLAGGGLQGLVAATAARMATHWLEGELDREPLVLDEGLSVEVLSAVRSGGEARLNGRVSVDPVRSTFTRQVPVLDEDGAPVLGEDGKPLKQEVTCHKLEVKVHVAWQVASGDAALASGEGERSSSASRCPGDGELPSADDLAAPLLSGWGRAAALEIAPSWRLVRVPLVADRGSRLELSQLRGADLASALCGYEGLARFDPTDRKAVVNRAAVLFALGHLDQAEEGYRAALALKGDKPTQEALASVKERRAQVETQTRAYLQTYAPQGFDFASCPPIPEGRRTTLKKEGVVLDAAGQVLAELGKGAVVFVQQEGDKATVALPDGRTGTLDGRLLR
jgi:hypothetical protein